MGLAKTVGILGLAAAFVGPVACKKPDKGRAGKRTVKASIADFDPKAEVQFNLDEWGTKRVDDYEVEQAFNRSFDAMDKCVAQAKSKAGMGPEDVIAGDVDFAVKLNPKKARPFAVNAEFSGSTKKWTNNKQLKDCLREAVAGVGFPTYDGPPQVAEFYTQIDPGMEDE